MSTIDPKETSTGFTSTRKPPSQGSWTSTKKTGTWISLMASSSKLQIPQPPQREALFLSVFLSSPEGGVHSEEMGKQSQKYPLTQFTSLNFEATQIHEMQMDFGWKALCVPTRVFCLTKDERLHHFPTAKNQNTLEETVGKEMKRNGLRWQVLTSPSRKKDKTASEAVGPFDLYCNDPQTSCLVSSN